MNYKKILSLLLLMPGLMIGMSTSDKLARLKNDLAIQEENIQYVGPMMKQQVQNTINILRSQIAQLEGGSVQRPDIELLKNELRIQESLINQVFSGMRPAVQQRIDQLKAQIGSN